MKDRLEPKAHYSDRPISRERQRHWLALTAIGVLLFLTNLGATRLWDVDEAIFSQTAVEMYERGDWVVPYFNGELFAHKPPVMYWCQMAAYHVFGTTEFAARLFSAFCGIGTMLVTYELGRLLFSTRAGLWAGIVLGSCVNFALISRAATPDAYLTFFCTLALWVLVRGTCGADSLPWQPKLSPSWAIYALAYAVMAVAVLVKGPVGIIIPTAVWGMFLLIEQRRAPHGEQASPLEGSRIMNALRLFSPPYFLKTVWRMRPLTAIAAVLLIAAPWYVWVGLRTNGEFLREFFFVHNIGRAANAMESHGGPIYYYLVAICIGTFPWCMLLGPALGHLVRGIRNESPARAGLVLISCWAGVWVGCFSLVGTKLPSYIIPAYPAIALGFAALVDSWLTAASAVDCRRWLRAAWSVTGVVGLGFLIVVPIVTKKYLGGEWTPALVGIIPLVGAFAGIWFSERGLRERSLVTMAVVGVLFCVGLLSFAVLPIDAHQNSKMFADFARGHSTGSPHWAGFNYGPPSLTYYTGQTVRRVGSAEEVADFFARNQQDAFLITTAKHFEMIVSSLPGGIGVLTRDRRFLKPGEVVLLGRAQAGDVARRMPPAAHR